MSFLSVSKAFFSLEPGFLFLPHYWLKKTILLIEGFLINTCLFRTYKTEILFTPRSQKWQALRSLRCVVILEPQWKFAQPSAGEKIVLTAMPLWLMVRRSDTRGRHHPSLSLTSSQPGHYEVKLKKLWKDFAKNCIKLFKSSLKFHL